MKGKSFGLSVLLTAINSLQASAAIIGGPITNPANGHLYYLLEQSCWSDSEAEAQRLGGHLATVNDTAENQWLNATFGQYGGIRRNLWIGLTDAKEEGKFEWSSGEPVTFTAWHPGEPNNASGLEDWVMLLGNGSEKWNDFASCAPTLIVNGVVEVGTSPVTPQNILNAVPAPPGLIGWWPGDANFTDLTGRMDGAPQNVTFDVGKVGKAFRFVGTNSFVRVPTQEAFRRLTNITLECWVLNDQAMPFRRFLTITPDHVILGLDPQGKPLLNMRFGDLAATPAGQDFRDSTALDSRPLTSGAWHHLAGTYDGSAVRLYVDGFLVASADAPGKLDSRGAGTELYINYLQSGEVGGLIDEVAVYSRALTPAEIQSHFVAGSAGMARSPVIRSIALAFPGEARVRVTGIPGRPLALQTSTDLLNWVPLAADANTSGTVNFTDPKAGSSFGQRFYRAVQR